MKPGKACPKHPQWATYRLMVTHGGSPITSTCAACRRHVEVIGYLQPYADWISGSSRPWIRNAKDTWNDKVDLDWIINFQEKHCKT